jgi:hypothetical protein
MGKRGKRTEAGITGQGTKIGKVGKNFGFWILDFVGEIGKRTEAGITGQGAKIGKVGKNFGFWILDV